MRITTLVHETPVSVLIPLGHDTVLSLEGLNHLGIRDGTARWLSRTNGAWSTSRTAKLPEGARAVVAGEHEAYVVGPESLTVVSFDGGVKKLQSLPLDLLYPSSMAREDSGALWIGARQFVLRFTPRVPAGRSTSPGSRRWGAAQRRCAGSFASAGSDRTRPQGA